MALLICSFCDYSTKRRYNLERHTKTMHGHCLTDMSSYPVNVTIDPVNVTLDPVNVTLDPVNVTLDPVNVTLDSPDVCTYKCPTCYKLFTRKDNLNAHKPKCKQVVDPLECELCHKVFASRHSKSRHMKICEGVKESASYVPQTIINNTTNNTTNNNNLTINNNIYINNFGQEDTSYIPHENVHEWLLQKNGRGLFNCLLAVHLSEDHPENHNIRLHQSLANVLEVKKEDKWVPEIGVLCFEKALRMCWSNHMSPRLSDDAFQQKLEHLAPNDYDTQLQLTQQIISNHTKFTKEYNSTSFYAFVQQFMLLLQAYKADLQK